MSGALKSFCSRKFETSPPDRKSCKRKTKTEGIYLLFSDRVFHILLKLART